MDPTRAARPALARGLARALSAFALFALTTGLAAQGIDQAYTAKIREYTTEPFFLTKYVDHLPASATVPSPMKHFGDIAGAPNVLHYPEEIHAYMRAVEAASPRVKTFSMGLSEEGREMLLVAISNEETIRRLDEYRQMNLQLADPRRTNEQQAEDLIARGKAMYWLTGAIHSTETGSPEMLLELVYRLAVSEAPYIQAIRDSMIVFVTPVVEVDGRARQVDLYMARRKDPDATLPGTIWWGHYVAHDNNRDNIGLSLKLSQHATRTFNQWQPHVLHDLHESQPFLYTSTGRGPYNAWLDPTTVNEWNRLAFREVKELTELGVPGVFTHDYYDGWAPNYMFWIANTRNSIGRFYEVQSYGPDNYVVRPGTTVTSREWFRPNPPLPSINWGPRNNTNIQQSALLIVLNHVARNKDLYLENYWLKNKRSVAKGSDGPVHAWLVPAGQRRKADAADAINELRRQGLEVHTAAGAFRAGNVEVAAGDWIIRADQPYRTLAEMYFSLQNFSPDNPRPYDDTGWTFPLMRNVVITPVTEKSILDQRMAMLAMDAHARGGVTGTGSVIVVDHTTDNNLVTFRYRFPNVRMQAAERDFEANGHRFRAGAFVIPNSGCPASQ
jgi:hypothetical protein